MSLEKLATEAGLRAARAMFNARSKGRGARNAEVHLSEAEVAAVFAIGWQAGYAVRAAPSREPGEPFRWLAEISVSAELVADGLELEDEPLWEALCRGFPFARCDGLKAKVLSGPPRAEVMREQGYSEQDIARDAAYIAEKAGGR